MRHLWFFFGRHLMDRMEAIHFACQRVSYHWHNVKLWLWLWRTQWRYVWTDLKIVYWVYVFHIVGTSPIRRWSSWWWWLDAESSQYVFTNRALPLVLREVLTWYVDKSQTMNILTVSFIEHLVSCTTVVTVVKRMAFWKRMHSNL